MAARGLVGGVVSMDRVREILRLHEQGFTQRAIHRATGVARSCIQEYLRAAALTGVTHERTAALSDAELRQVLGKQSPGRQKKAVAAAVEWEKIHTELHGRKGVTLELLFSEWVEATGGGLSYSTFCRRYAAWASARKVVLRQEYRPGEKLLSDYAGVTLSWWDDDGNEHPAQIFVAALGASNKTFAEATDSQKVLSWIGSHVRAFQFFGGVAEAVVIDNLKSGVTRSHRYEPELNRTFAEFGAHFNTSILPARAGKPRDKAKVEKAVQEVERWVIAPIRHMRFASLTEINLAMAPLLERLNSRTMRDYGASRNELFDRLEQDQLRPLPVLPFTAAEWKCARVAMDYHVQIHQHYYSVPYYHARKEVWVRITEKLVEVFLNNERIASHVRSTMPYRHTTLPAHMPPHHLAVKSWTAENFLSWAHRVGPETEKLVHAFLNAPQYKEVSYRSILGLQRLEKRFGQKNLERASQIANERRLLSQRAVKQILETLPAKPASETATPVRHGNIRGDTYYH